MQQMSDEQIFNADVCEVCGWKKECKRCLALKAAMSNVGADGGESNFAGDAEEDDEECGNGGGADCSGDPNDDDDDDDDDFECDIERYVTFQEKLEFAERLKSCSQDYSKECLTEIIKTIQDVCPQAVEDYRNSRIQLKIDMIERDAHSKSLEIMDKF